MELRVGVLGATEAWDGSRRLDLGTPRQLAVLAALALQRGRAVPVDRLVDLVWGAAPPGSVGVTLQGYVAGLRRALEPGRAARSAAAVVVLERQGYALRLSAGALDADRFETEVLGLDGRPHRSEDVAEDVARADSTLALWRDTPYASLGDHPDVAAERDRLAGLRLSLLEHRAALMLDLGRAETVAAELEPLTTAHPLRERLWALRARALARAGRQAESLAVLGRVRERLVEELGVEPGREIRDLQVAVLRQEVGPDAAPPRTSTGRPVPGAAAGSATPTPATPDTTATTGMGRGRWPLVGHRDELADLVASVRECVEGVPMVRVAAVVGDPGIGKSRLCQEVAAVAETLGARVVVGRCAVDAPALWPWLAVLQVLGRSLPVAPGNDATGAFRARESLVDTVLEACHHTPTVLVLEDLHWADTTSLLVLRRLIGQESAARLLVLTTRRPGPGASDELGAVAEAAARAHGVHLELRGLDRAGCAELSTAVAGVPTDHVAADVLLRRTGGNPFFLVELARLPLDDPEAVPTSVRDVLLRRVGALPEGVADLLRTAAVVGRELPVSLLSDVAGLDPPTTLERLELATRQGLLEETGVGRFRFAHALVQETLLDTLSRTRRADLHARAAIASHAPTTPAEASALARHWLAAGPEHARAAWQAAVGAARAARSVFGYDEGIALLRGAVDAARDDAEASDDERAEVLLELADLLRVAGRLAEARPVVHEVLALPTDDGRLLRAALLPAEGAFWLASAYGVVDEVVVVALRDLLDRWPDGDDPRRCRAMLALASETYYGSRVAEREALVDAAVAMAGRIGEDRLTLSACTAASVTLWRSARSQEQHALAGRARDLADRLGDRSALGTALTVRATTAHDLGLVSSLDQALAEARAVASEQHQPLEQVILSCLDLGWTILRGEVDEAQRLLDGMRAITATMRLDQADDLFVAAEVMQLLWSGELELLLGRLDAVAGHARSPLTSLRVVLLCRTGQVERARDLLASGGDLRVEADDWLSLAIWSLSAEASLHLGDRALAARTYELLAPFAGRPASTGTLPVLGPVDLFLAHAAAACGEQRTASRHAADAERLAEQWRAPVLARWVRQERDRWGF